MKRFLILIIFLPLAACVNPIAAQYNQMNNSLNEVDQKYANCVKTVRETPEAIRLNNDFLVDLNKKDRYLEKLTNPNYASDEQISDIYSYFNNLNVCRDTAVDELQNINTDYAALVSKYYSLQDKITIDTINRELTIGKANESYMSLHDEFIQQLGEVHQKQYNVALQAQREQLQAQREQNLANLQVIQQLQNNTYRQQILNNQQQMINNMNRPTRTNCNYVGNYLNCNTY